MALRLTFHQKMPGGEEAMNVFHVDGGFIDIPTIDGVLDIFQTFYTTLAAYLHTQWVLQQIDVAVAGGPTVRSELVTGLDGNAAGTPMPNDCALLIHWMAGASDGVSRTPRSRSWIGGLTTAAVSTQTGTAAATLDLSTAQGVAAACGTLLGALPAEHVLQVYRPASVDADVLDGYVSNRWATQRRRDRDTPEIRSAFT